MNILHITNDGEDVSGRIAYELHRVLINHGYNSRILFKQNCEKYTDRNVAQIGRDFRYICYQLKRKAKQLTGINDEIPSDPDYHFYNQYENRTLFSTKKIIRQVPFKPDIIILYWVSKTINSKNIYELNLSTKTPILWYLMDMAALTGGCHYAWDCDGYKNSCGRCPAIYSSNKKDRTYNNLLLKKKYFGQTNLFAIVGSERLYQQAKESILFRKKPIYKVMVGRGPETFKPSNKQLVRTTLGIPSDKKVIFFGATSYEQKRKGLSYLLKAFQHLKKLLCSSNRQNDLLLVIAGNHNKGLFEQLPFDYKYIGMLNSDKELASAYQASDIFVCSSVEDSGPLMINESIMCGTPVVSFDMGVAPDLVHNGKTGYRAKLKDSVDLAHGIYNILNSNNAEYVQMCNNCRELGLKLYSPSVQLQAFERVFKSIRANSS